MRSFVRSIHPHPAALDPACVAGTSVRWSVPADSVRLVPVWLGVQPRSADPWSVRNRQLVESAIEGWNSVGLPVRFTPAPSRGRADVRIDVVDRFLPQDPAPGLATRGGATQLTYSDTRTIERAQIMIARETTNGIPYSSADIEAILLHELGHALGLPHSPRLESIMAPAPVVSTLTAVDASAARMLYRAPRCAAPATAATSSGAP